MTRASLTDSVAANRKQHNQYQWVQTDSQFHLQLFHSIIRHPHHLVYHLYRPLNTHKDHLHLEHQGEEVEELREAVWGVEEGFNIIRARDLMMELEVLVERQRGEREEIGREVRRREEGGDLRSQRGSGARPTFRTIGNAIWQQHLQDQMLLRKSGRRSNISLHA
jgi:hypothetical protein